MAYWKKIKNSDAVPVLKDELVFDETPTVNSTNPVTSDGVARAIAGASGEVPAVTENDNGKVLTAIYDAGGPAVEWDTVSVPTVDQNYSASSENAQSGVAVAQAISGIPSYTAGDGIDITSGEVSVKAGNGLSIGNVTSSEQVDLVCTEFNSIPDIKQWAFNVCKLTPELLSKISTGTGLDITTTEDVSAVSDVNRVCAALYTVSGNTLTNANRLVFNPFATSEGFPSTVPTIPAGTTVNFSTSNINSTYSNVTLTDVENNISDYYVGLVLIMDYGSTLMAYYAWSYDVPLGTTSVVLAYYNDTVTITDALNVDLPVPSTTGHSQGEVLSIGSSGIQWSAPAIGDVTSIRQVNALPATPDAHTLYLIPEA